MKLSLKYISVVLFGAVFAMSCDDLNRIEFGSAEQAGEIHVEYSQGGVEVKSLSYSSGSQVVTVDVTLNNEDLKWNIVSDADWIEIAEETHRGSGSFSFLVTSNPGFEDRPQATLSFVAGQFKGFDLTVDQRGNVFILSSAYHIASSAQGTASMTVSVPEGVGYEVESDEWITVEGVQEGAASVELTLSWDENTAQARYGKVNFIREGSSGADASFEVFQFGTEAEFAQDGSIQLAAEEAQVVDIMAPANIVEQVICPDWVTYTTEITGTHQQYSFAFEDNPSDCKKDRSAEVILKIKDYDTPVSLPLLSQAYCPAYGFISAEGMKMFADAWNNGEDVSDWQSEDGAFEIMANVDFTGVEGWKSIGTEEHPFTGVFDGKYREIQGLAASAPLFGVCEGAALKNVTVAESSSFSLSGEYADEEYILSPLVAEAKDCVVSECVNRADVTLSASNNITKYIYVWMSGLVGKASGSTEITKCENYGKISLSESVHTSYQKAILALGGVVAFNHGATVRESRNYGQISDKADIYYHHVGGIAGVNNGAIESSENHAKVSLEVMRAQSSGTRAVDMAFIGGIAGLNYAVISSCTNDAEIYMNTDAYYPYIGGIAGGLGRLGRSNLFPDDYTFDLDGLSVASNSNLVSGKVTSAGSARYGAAGGLYGGVSKEMELDFTGSQSAGPVSVLNGSTSVYPTYYAGGLIGFATDTVKIVNAVAEAEVKYIASNSDKKVGATKIAVGGVIGYVEGVLELVSCKSSGTIRFEVKEVTFEENTSDSGPTYVGAGGLAGLVMDGFKADGCENLSEVGFDGENTGSNGFPFAVGGIVGRVAAGNAEIAGCHNKADLKNAFRTNTKWNNGDNLGINYLGGIIGQYRTYKGEEEGELRIISCTNEGALESSRGAAGGIIGFANNATITSCSNTGSMASGNRIMAGGIAGVAFNNTVVENSSAECIVSSTENGAGPARSGGIVAVLSNSSRISGCSFSGQVKVNSSTTDYGMDYAGAIVGVAAKENSSNPIKATEDDTCRIENCKVKGKVADTELTADNFKSLLCGVCAGSSLSDDNSYWNN